jgi:hypothetical protein
MRLITSEGDLTSPYTFLTKLQVLCLNFYHTMSLTKLQIQVISAQCGSAKMRAEAYVNSENFNNGNLIRLAIN